MAPPARTRQREGGKERLFRLIRCWLMSDQLWCLFYQGSGGEESTSSGVSQLHPRAQPNPIATEPRSAPKAARVVQTSKGQYSLNQPLIFIQNYSWKKSEIENLSSSRSRSKKYPEKARLKSCANPCSPL